MFVVILFSFSRAHLELLRALAPAPVGNMPTAHGMSLILLHTSFVSRPSYRRSGAGSRLSSVLTDTVSFP